MPSLCLSCLLFTLEDKEVKNNKYIHTFIIWLSHLIQYGNLREGDALYIISDNRTIEYIKNTENTIFSTFCSFIKFRINLIHYEPPKTMMEGMMLRYRTNDYTQDIYMYCDIDILILDSLHRLTDSMIENHIYICLEGDIKNIYYSNGIPEELMLSIDCEKPGVSSGKFAIYGKEICKTLFEVMNSLCNYNLPNTTLDQPVFNYSIILLKKSGFLINEDLLINYVSLNGEEYKKGTTILFDCAGFESGNDEIHYKKMFDISILFQSGYFNLPRFQ
jgi:hypothetical protein